MAYVRRAFVVILVVLVVGVIVYDVQIIRRLATLTADLQKAQGDLSMIESQHQSELQAIGTRLDELERTLFGDVVAKLAKVPLSTRVELWQRNRDKELRDRLTRLEQWRARHPPEEP